MRLNVVMQNEEPGVKELNKLANNTAVIYYYKHDSQFQAYLKLSGKKVIHLREREFLTQGTSEALKKRCWSVCNDGDRQFLGHPMRDFVSKLTPELRKRMTDNVIAYHEERNNHHEISLLNPGYDDKKQNDFVIVRGNSQLVEAIWKLDDAYFVNQRLEMGSFNPASN